MITALVVLSALLHATWNGLLRLEADKDRSMVIATVVAALFAFAVAGVRWGLGEPPFSSWAGVGFAVAAGVFEATYFAALAAAMARGTLGTVYTVSRGGAVVLVWPLSIALFAEVATLGASLGTGLVLIGLVLTGLARRGGGRHDQPGAVRWALACALAIAGYHLGYKAALREGIQPSACFAVALGVAAAINVARMAMRAGELGAMRALVGQRWPRLVVIGAICAGSFLLLMEALAVGGSGFVLTLRNTSVLFALGLSWWIGERPSRRELAGAALVALGAAVMAW